VSRRKATLTIMVIFVFILSSVLDIFSVIHKVRKTFL